MKRTIQQTLMAALCAAALSASGTQNLVQNGDFEATPRNADTATNTFLYWEELASSLPTNVAKAQVGVTRLSGGCSAELLPSGGGSLYQSITRCPSAFTFGCRYANFSMGAKGNCFLFSLNMGGSTSLSVRVFTNLVSGVSTPVLQVRSNTTWITVSNATSALQSSFSTDTSTWGVFNSTDTVVTNTLSIACTFRQSPTYTITLNDVTSRPLAWFDSNLAPRNLGVQRISFTCANSSFDKDYLLDDVALIPAQNTGSAILFY